MLDYNSQYQISNGVYNTFNLQMKHRSLSTRHSNETIQKKKCMYTSKFNLYSKENYITANLLVNFKYKPSSINASLQILENLSNDEIITFKNEILSYKKHINDNIVYLKGKYNSPNADDMFKEYNKGNIKWYTFWFWARFSENIPVLEKSRIKKGSLQRIKSLLLFVSFKEDSLQVIKDVIQESLDI